MFLEILSHEICEVSSVKREENIILTLNIHPKCHFSNFQVVLVFFMIILYANTGSAGNGIRPTPTLQSDDLKIKSATVRYISDMDLMVFEQLVEDTAGGLVPKARGQLDGAPVLSLCLRD